MKQHIIQTGTIQSIRSHVTVFPQPAARGWALSSAIVAALSCLSFSSASAAGVDGQYQVLTAKGSIEFAGATIRIPASLIRRFARVDNASITVTNNRIRINRKGAVRIAERLGDEIGLDLVTDVSGPTTLRLEKDGGSYTGSTSTPVTVSFKHTTFVKLEGSLQISVDAEASNGNLTLTMPLGGKFLSKKIGGSMTVVCER